MKKTIKAFGALLLAACMSLPAMAEKQDNVSLSGTLQPESRLSIAAPFTGRVLSCKIMSGDLVKAGDRLIELETVGVYAPCDGVVAGVRADEGDALSAIRSLYGAAMYVEPTSEYVVSASTTNAYDSNDNRMIHVGETVYLTSVNNHSRTGVGVITQVDGENYMVEVTEGNLRLNETCRISRDDDYEEEDGRIGQGKTVRNNPLPVTAEGSVVKLHVKEGDEVKRGQLLMEVAPDEQTTARSGIVEADEDLVVISVAADEGVQVQKGQTIVEVFPDGTLQAVVYADEDELLNIEIGDRATVELDVDPDTYCYAGEVESISYVPAAGMSNVCYEVRVRFENDDVVRMGMSITVELEK